MLAHELRGLIRVKKKLQREVGELRSENAQLKAKLRACLSQEDYNPIRQEYRFIAVVVADKELA